MLSHVRPFATPWTAESQAFFSSTISESLLRFMSIELVMLFNHLILCWPLLLLPLVFHSIRVFSNEMALCIRWPNYWSFSFSISSSNEWWWWWFSYEVSNSCDPMDCSPPGSSVHGILQARILGWVAISFSREFPHPGIEPRSPALQADSLLTELFLKKQLSNEYSGLISFKIDWFDYVLWKYVT